MNAFELADELDKILKSIGLEDNRVPTMLRQQADRIAELEEDLKDAKSELALDAKVASLKMKLQQAFKMLEEAVAGWDNAEKELMKSTPQIKELSDAEISQISHRYHYTYNPDYVGFARAILKKARNK